MCSPRVSLALANDFAIKGFFYLAPLNGYIFGEAAEITELDSEKINILFFNSLRKNYKFAVFKICIFMEEVILCSCHPPFLQRKGNAE